MADIFISYKREEQHIAEKLAAALVRKGYSVWWDPELRAGESVDEAIEKELMAAKCVIVLWSRLSVKSEYIKAEAVDAWKRKKLVPVKIEDAAPPFPLGNIQAGNLIGWDGSDNFPGFRKLLSDLAARPGMKRVSEAPQKEKPSIKPAPSVPQEPEPKAKITFFEQSERVPLPAPKLELKTGLQPSLTWTEIQGAPGYVLERSENPSFFPAEEVYSGEKNEYSDISPSVSPQYYRVKAKGGIIKTESEWSNTVETEKLDMSAFEALKTPERKKLADLFSDINLYKSTGKLPAPKLELQKTKSPLFFMLTWTKVPWASVYVLERTEIPNLFPWVVVYSGEENEYSEIRGSGGYYRVKAKAALSERDSEWSNIVIMRASPGKGLLSGKKS
jgi:hypothetical protein